MSYYALFRSAAFFRIGKPGFWGLWLPPASIALQPSQPLLRILNLSNTRISVFPGVEEFLVMLYGFGFVPLLLVNLTEHVEALGVDVAITMLNRDALLIVQLNLYSISDNSKKNFINGIGGCFCTPSIALNPYSLGLNNFTK